MARTFRCPRCQTATSRNARRCSNPECRAELGLCSHCKDIAAVRNDDEGGSRVLRDRLVCDLCGERVVRCRTAQLGGACNGLARASGWYSHQFCDDCSGRAFDLVSRVGVLALGTAAGYLLRRPRR